MKKLTAALAIAAALTLSACSAPAETTPTGPAASAPASVTAAPIPAQAAAPTSEAASEGEDVAAFLKVVKSRWVDTAATDDQLVAAGKLACEQLRTGKTELEVSVVDGFEAGDYRNSAIVAASQFAMCPDTIPAPPTS